MLATFCSSNLSTTFQSNEKWSRVKDSWSKFDQFLSKILPLFEGGLQKRFGTILNWRRWSENVEVKLPEISSGEIISENISSLSDLEWEVSQVGCKIYGVKEL